MRFQLSSDQRRQLLSWAERAAPQEACGLIYGADNRSTRLELASNISDYPERHFEIDPVRLIAAEKRDRAGQEEIAGYFHSHPNGRPAPSQYDAEMARDDGRVWLIIARPEVTAWRYIRDEGFLPCELVIAD